MNRSHTGHWIPPSKDCCRQLNEYSRFVWKFLSKYTHLHRILLVWTTQTSFNDNNWSDLQSALHRSRTFCSHIKCDGIMGHVYVLLGVRHIHTNCHFSVGETSRRICIFHASTELLKTVCVCWALPCSYKPWRKYHVLGLHSTNQLGSWLS